MMQGKKLKVVLGAALLLAVTAGIFLALFWRVIMPTREGSSDAMWVDRSSGVVVVRNPSVMSNAALHEGSFSVGQDGCLYVAVVEDRVTKYIAAVDPTVTITQGAVSDRGISYEMGATAWFSKAALRGDLPNETLSICQEAKEVFGVSLVKPPKP
jgi:hypothetical protein